MNKENRCIAAGCSGSCCRNISLKLNPEEYDLWSDGVVIRDLKVRSVAREEGLRELLGEYPRIVYREHASESSQMDVKVFVYGDCPHLVHDECDIYVNRPEACKEFERGSKACVSMRARDGLSPIQLEEACSCV